MQSHGPARVFKDTVDLAIDGVFNGFNMDLAARIGASNYVREFRTIHINMGRRIGKTHYILNHYREHDLIIVHDEQMKYHLNGCGVIATIKTPRELKGDLRQYHWIWIDEPRLCSRQTGGMGWLYGAKFSSDSLVIMLGE